MPMQFHCSSLLARISISCVSTPRDPRSCAAKIKEHCARMEYKRQDMHAVMGRGRGWGQVGWGWLTGVLW
eukprot:12283803-Alexandrium_andersonii.AAC.1